MTYQYLILFPVARGQPADSLRIIYLPPPRNESRCPLFPWKRLMNRCSIIGASDRFCLFLVLLKSDGIPCRLRRCVFSHHWIFVCVGKRLWDYRVNVHITALQPHFARWIEGARGCDSASGPLGERFGCHGRCLCVN